MVEPIHVVPEGTLLIDCTPLAGVLKDLPPRGMVGMRSEQPGYRDVVVEITSNQSTVGIKAGVLQEDVDAIVEADRQIEQIDAYLPALRKLVQMLVETRAVLDDERHKRISAIVKTIDVRTQIKGSDELLAKYEKTRKYRSAIAMKGVQTRRKNAAAAADDAEKPVESAPPRSDAPAEG